MLLAPLLVAFLGAISAQPLIIRTNAGRAQGDAAQAKVQDLVAKELINSDSHHQNQEAFQNGNEKKFTNALDSAKYGQSNEDKKVVAQQGGFGDQKFNKNAGQNEANFGKKVGHHKKHHKTGFHNTYHKDESGSNSSYFDDSNDEADEFIRDSKKGVYNDEKANFNKGLYEDRNGYSNQNQKAGGYSNGGQFNREGGNRNHYKDARFYDNNQQEGLRRNSDQYGQRKRFENEEKFVEPHHHHHEHHTPYYNKQPFYPAHPVQEPLVGYDIPDKRVITVYEDPRVLGRFDEYNDFNRGYDNGRVRLDVRPPLDHRRDRFYHRRPVYDEYY